MEYEKVYGTKDKLYFNHSRPELLRFIPDNIERVLDVGCGVGNFGKMLKEVKQCSVWGIEPDGASIKIAQENLDKVFQGLFNSELALEIKEKFDCIFFNDVLEHLIDPEEALILCKKLLKKDGCIIASIPNIRFYPVILSLLRYRDFKYAEAGVLDKTHLRFFTKKSMERLFSDSGFQINKIEGINKHTFGALSLINILTFNQTQDMFFPQYAIVAKPNDKY